MKSTSESATMTANMASMVFGTPSPSFTIPAYPPVTRSKVRLNHSKGAHFLCPGSCGLRSTAQRAGVRVSATMPEMMTETAMVSANCL